MLVRPANPSDSSQWAAMRQALWPPEEEGEHEREIAAFFAGALHDVAEVFLAIDDSGRAVGFAEVSLRSHAESCRSTPVAYLEGWFVDEAARRTGVGAALIEAVESWGRSHGCTEMASDTELDNIVSQQVHQALGFEEADRVVCFRKSL
jgi:aminoglycoside 6'-N-acetyltransferase I